jgi:hypothetical protein
MSRISATIFIGGVIRSPLRSGGLSTLIERRTQADVIEKILRHCGLWIEPGPRAPPKFTLAVDLDPEYIPMLSEAKSAFGGSSWLTSEGVATGFPCADPGSFWLFAHLFAVNQRSSRESLPPRPSGRPGREGFHPQILEFVPSRVIFNPWAEIKIPIS